ncbi:polynucleotide adenylyltransferase PcnB [Thalassotalea eurytherma]|uniref:Poly(A) polymerase I n=1 Tax=Thalassotalea eurytherma TaxID=1144278 RepID=A0ABQ6H8Y3_9GAMM|nr:polynucleotide adenylyltransferase PcnB [Thalassotalea eurytherma]GLX82911.1 poly(A) polymerase I [Thalassotalea eurytherma]
MIPRDQHPVSRQFISNNALKVLYRLNKGGYEAYLVGGGVRDILLGLTPKDFDIVTNATPEQIKGLFRNCRLIGRRFRLAHIVFGRDIIEVATFRGHHDDTSGKNTKISKQSDQGMLLRDNIYGSIEEDAERRDFTINALYYSTQDFKVYDFAGGVHDIEQRKIRLIGDPETRYREDPVRMLRAIRFATKLDMTISPETQAPIKPLASLLSNIPAARMFEEFLKLFVSGKAQANFNLLREYDLFEHFFPAVERALCANDNFSLEESELMTQFIAKALDNTDIRIANDQRVTPAFLFASILWFPLQKRIETLKANSDILPQDAFFQAYHELMSEQQQSVAIPKRFQLPIKDIWILQERFEKRDPKRAFKTLEHPKFRAGYDFLLLRAEFGDDQIKELAKWWTEFQDASSSTQSQMLKTTGRANPHRKVRRKRRPNKKAASE